MATTTSGWVRTAYTSFTALPEHPRAILRAMIRLLPAFLLLTTACLPDFPTREFTEDPAHDGDGVTELE